MTTTTRTITIPSQLDPVAVFGPVDEVIRQVEHAFPDLTIIVRGDRVAIVSHSKSTESQASRAEDVIHTIIQAAYSAPMDADTVRRLLDQDVLPNKVRAEHPGYGRSAERGRASLGAARSGDARKPRIPGVITFAAGQPVRAKTAGQIAYVNAVDAHTITFAIGPAGTGKTYLAVAKAVRAFQDRRIRRIILTRPAVEAGESLGFLPGTLNDAYVILDEAQNTTEQQMKMFLTRLGFNTTMIITGDVTQVDLAVPRSGLATIEGILGGIDDIAFAHLDAGDVVRHELVGRIVEAYDRHDATRVRRNRGKESREDAQ